MVWTCFILLFFQLYAASIFWLHLSFWVWDVPNLLLEHFHGRLLDPEIRFVYPFGLLEGDLASLNRFLHHRVFFLFLVLGLDLGWNNLRYLKREQPVVDCQHEHNPLVSIGSVSYTPLLSLLIVGVTAPDGHLHLLNLERVVDLPLVDQPSE